jgi:hypothetical protein
MSKAVWIIHKHSHRFCRANFDIRDASQLTYGTCMLRPMIQLQFDASQLPIECLDLF